ncbi:MAG: SGNH/GDSL hydrolase family protein [Pseudomonadota bacterium]
MRTTLLAAAFVTAAQLTSAATLDPLPWTDLVVFGDSLSDQGNFGPGRIATNGDTWATQLGATSWIEGGTNYAFLGATAADDPNSVDFDDQRDLFRNAPPDLGSDPLVVIYFGGNDLFNNPSEAGIAAAIQAIGAGVAELTAEFGLTRYAFLSLIDLGLIPRFAGTPEAPLATAASLAFNDALEVFADSGESLGLDLTYVDIEALVDTVLADPSSFGFSDVTGTCVRGAISCDGFLFWDDSHPTEAAHSFVAQTVLEAVSPAPVPLPASVWLFAGGLVLLVAARRTA